MPTRTRAGKLEKGKSTLEITREKRPTEHSDYSVALWQGALSDIHPLESMLNYTSHPINFEPAFYIGEKFRGEKWAMNRKININLISYPSTFDSQIQTSDKFCRFGRRELMLFSLYLSTVSTVVCATVPNYNTLLISRAFIGFCAGLNFSIHAVLIAELSTNKARLEKTILIGSNMYSVGGLWAGVLGYLLLDVLGWRTFILLTSLPFFIPPIFMLHFCIEGLEDPQGCEEKDQVVQKEEVIVPNFVARTAKLATYHAIHVFLGWMTILLVPALIQLFKIEESELAADCTVSATQGAELLLLSTVTFAVIPGKIFSHYTRDRISFQKMQVVVALLNVGVFAIMLAQRNIVAAVVTNFVVKFLYGVANMDFWNIYTDVNYFGTVRFALGSSIAAAMGLAGAVVGTATVSFAPILAAMSTALVLSFLQVLVVLSMNEVK